MNVLETKKEKQRQSKKKMEGEKESSLRMKGIIILKGLDGIKNKKVFQKYPRAQISSVCSKFANLNTCIFIVLSFFRKK